MRFVINLLYFKDVVLMECGMTEHNIKVFIMLRTVPDTKRFRKMCKIWSHHLLVHLFCIVHGNLLNWFTFN